MTSFIANPAGPIPEAVRDASSAVAPGWEVVREGVRIIALRALGNASLAEDIAQESVARAIAALDSNRADSIGDVGAFVYGIARHLIADVHRGSGRSVSIDSVAAPPAPHVDALNAVIADEDAARVRVAVSQLPAGDRDLLRLYFVEGLQADEIAKRLREPMVNVRKRKSRALERLRRIFLGCHAEAPSPTRKA